VGLSLCSFLVLVACSSLLMAAQTSQFSVTEAVEVHCNEHKTIPFHQVIKVSVKNSEIVDVLKTNNNMLIIIGLLPGETQLEIVNHEKHLTRLRIKVLPERVSLVKTLRQAKWSLVNVNMLSELVAINNFATYSKTGVLSDKSLPSSEKPTGNQSTTPPRNIPATRQSLEDRFQLTVDPIFGFDKEKIQISEFGQDNIVFQQWYVVFPFNFQWKLSNRNRVSISIPFISRQDVVRSESSTLFSSKNNGLGDIQLTFEQDFSRVRKSNWDVFTGATASFPTGKSIYNNDPDESPLGLGHYVLGGFIGIRQVADPVLFSASVGLNYTLPRKVGPTHVKPGVGYSFQTGFGYALSDRWIFSEQLNYSLQPNIFLVNLSDTLINKTSQAYLSHSLIYNPKNKCQTFRFTYTQGLNNESTDYNIGLTYQCRW